jgi:hypothetical protein
MAFWTNPSNNNKLILDTVDKEIRNIFDNKNFQIKKKIKLKNFSILIASLKWSSVIKN